MTNEPTYDNQHLDMNPQETHRARISQWLRLGDVLTIVQAFASMLE
jgi:hypothetical protein